MISHTISTYTHSPGDHIHSSNLQKLQPYDNIFQSKLPAKASLINSLFLITFLHSFFFLKIPPLHLTPPCFPSISVNVTPLPPMQIFKPKSRGPCGVPLFSHLPLAAHYWDLSILTTTRVDHNTLTSRSIQHLLMGILPWLLDPLQSTLSRAPGRSLKNA